MKPILATLKGLNVDLGGRRILDGIDVELLRGTITAIIGPNGAGKTTLLRALLQEIPFQGTIRFHCGHTSATAPGHIGYMPQRLRIDSNLPLTVLDLFGLSLRRWPWILPFAGGFKAEVRGHLEGVGAAHLIDSLVEKLSGGELQRVLLALALQPMPELLLLDEPAAGIDFQMQEEFYLLISRLNKENGITVLMVSHDLSMVSKIVGHVWCLKDGRLACQGTPHDLLHGDALAKTFGPNQGMYAHKH